MNTHPVLAFLIGATFVAMIPTTSAMAQEKEQTDFAALIRQLDAKKANHRDEAKMKLIKAGVPAVDIVLKSLLDKGSPREIHARCISILSVWEKEGEARMVSKLTMSFKDLDPADYPHARRSLEEIKLFLLPTPEQAVKYLQDHGCRIADKDLTIGVFLNKWNGTLDDFRLIRVFEKPLEVDDMRGELLPALDGMDVKLITFARPKGSTGRNPKYYKLDKSDFEILASFNNLRRLDMGYFEFDNESLMPLVEASTLPTLTLSPVSNDETIRVISRIKSLETLNFGQAKISGEGFAHISNLKNLRTVNLPYMSSDEALKTIGKLPKLETLRCGYEHKITGSGFKYLRDLDNLKNLHLPKGIDPKSLDFLDSLESLQTLELSGFTINDSVMDYVVKAKKLRSLKLTETMVRGTTFSELKDLHQLDFIHFSRNYFTSDVAVEQLIELPNLRRIYSEWTPFTDRSLELVLKSKSIESVGLRNGLLTQKGIDKFNATKQKREYYKRAKFVPESDEHVKALQNLLDKGAGMMPNIGFTAKDGTHKYLVQIHLMEGVWEGTGKDFENLRSIPNMILYTNLKEVDPIIQIIKKHHEQFYGVIFVDGTVEQEELSSMGKLVRVHVGLWDPRNGWKARDGRR